MGVFIVTVCMLAAGANSLPAQMERMTVSKMKMSDLETSATGYSYDRQHGLPVSYVRYSDHGSGHYYDAPAPVSYVATAPASAPYGTEGVRYEPTVVYVQQEPVTYVKEEPNRASYVNHAGYAPVQSGYVVPVAPKEQEALAPYYVPAKADEVPYQVQGASEKYHDDEDDDDDDDDGYEHGHSHHQGHGDFEVPTKNYGFQGFDKPRKIIGLEVELPTKVVSELGGPYKAALDAYQHGAGKEYAAEGHAAHGEKGEKGYKNHRRFDEGQKGEHDSQHHKGHYDEEGGHKKAHSEAEGHYGHHNEAEKGEKGASFGHQAHHKKGHKTTGFHNVYRKDEYKKDTDFYDEDHKGGHHDKHAAFDEHHAAAEGARKEGGHLDSAHDQAEEGKEGHFEKGHDRSAEEGHKGEEGEESYHEQQADYASKGESSEGKEHGYSKGHGHHH